MPNHTYHEMQISGESEVLKKFIANHFDGEDFDFQSILPMPAELVGTTSPPRVRDPELIEKFGADNWYDWTNANWGTKWNAYDCSMNNTNDMLIEASFQTAWDTPRPIFKKLGELYPELTFSLQIVEEGGYFGGTVDIVAGEVVEDLTEAQWKEYAILLMGYEDDEDEQNEVRILSAINDLKHGKVNDTGVVSEMANFIKCNMEEFIKFSKP